jgi:outer membrane protein OmpA-like peptidoglycan-associated protein
MKILTTGFLVFLCWASLSIWFYVCKIKGLCSEHETIMISTIKVNDAFTADSLPNTLAGKPAMPDKLLVYFAFDKSAIIMDSDMTKFYDASITYMFHNSDAGLKITGHTDSKGSEAYNQALGYRRAISVRNYFENKGIPAAKMSVESKGETEPAENNSNEEGRAKNRRTSVTIKN